MITCERCDEPAAYVVNQYPFPELRLCQWHYEERQESICTGCGLEKKNLTIIDDERQLCKECLQEERRELLLNFVLLAESYQKTLKQRIAEALQADETAREKARQCGIREDLRHSFQMGYFRQCLLSIASDMQIIQKGLDDLAKKARALV